LDERGESWHLWSECRDSADFDSLAAAQIPMPLSTQDPFWVNAARTIFSAAAFEMRNDPDRSIHKLLRYLLTADLEQIQRFLKGTEAETLVSDKIEKTAISIKSVLATYLKSMKYIKDETNPFSIREWVQNDNAANWLFITSLGDRHETLKPLISAWLDIAVNALLSLPASNDRRLWLILDELTSLQPLPYLTQALSEARKFGGCIVIGIQNAAQLAKLYGHDGGREISSLLNTRLMFRQPDPDMAKWSAINLGETVTDEVREGISYGANTMRDGISINRVETRKPVVTFSEIMRLPNLQAYARLPGNYPLAHVQFNYQARPKMNAPFCLRAFDDNQLKEAEEKVQAEKETLSSVVKGKCIQKQKKKIPLLNDTLPT
jgi:type IV conjugative transfer system coupling protein TraD